MTHRIGSVLVARWRRVADWFAHGQLGSVCSPTCRV
jgi:hypothetical protein